jgi:hypothetical protein
MSAGAGVVELMLRLISAAVLIIAFASLNAEAQDQSVVEADKLGNSISARLTEDVNRRVPETVNVPIEWRATHYGYFTTYRVDNVDYMAVYDKRGNYKETLKKKPWDDRAPENLRLEFGNSQYSLCSVITFWEATQTYNKDFFFELMDKEGKARFAWSDENGKFTNQPSFFR